MLFQSKGRGAVRGVIAIALAICVLLFQQESRCIGWIDVISSDPFADFIYQNDWSRKEQDSLPLLPIQWGHDEQIAKKWNLERYRGKKEEERSGEKVTLKPHLVLEKTHVQNHKVQSQTEENGKDQEGILCRRLDQKTVDFTKGIEGIEHFNDDQDTE